MTGFGRAAGTTLKLKPEARASRATLEQLERTKRMRRAGQIVEAENLLQALIDRAETDGLPVEHWFYEHLAVLYHEQGDHVREVATLERYLGRAPASAAMSEMMKRRLEKARQEAGQGLKA